MTDKPRVLPHGYIDPWQTVDPVMPGNPGAQNFVIGGVMPAAPLGPNVGSPGVSGAVLQAVYNYQRYALVNGSKVFSVGTTSTVSLIDQSTGWRVFLHIRNASGSGGANIYLNFGAVATIDSAGIAGSSFKLAPDEQILFDAAVPQDDMYAIADAAGGLISVSYGVMALPGP